MKKSLCNCHIIKIVVFCILITFCDSFYLKFKCTERKVLYFKLCFFLIQLSIACLIYKFQEELALAESQSAFVNKAYFTLLKPLSRGQYLLEIHGDPIEETNSAVDPSFLMEVMEINEDIAEAVGNKEAMNQLDDINNARMEKCIENVSKAFAADDVPKAKECLIKLKYFSNIDDKIRELYRQNMDQ